MSVSFSGQDLFNWYQKAQQQAIAFDIPSFEVDWLVQELTNLDRLSLRTSSYRHQAKIKSIVSLAELEQLWRQRKEDRCPVQYLVGQCHWRNFTLKVTPDVLIPRPETEIIMDIVAEITEQNPQLKQGNWLDLGTGSGAIAIGLAEILPSAQIYAIDKSNSALQIAQENAQTLGYQEKIKFYHGSWFRPLEQLGLKFSGIVSNPPYIPSHSVIQLQPEVAQHEPKIALDGGDDGLEEIRHLIKYAPDFLQNGGVLIMEMMQGQAQPIKNLLQKQGSYTRIETSSDLAQISRFIVAFSEKNT